MGMDQGGKTENSVLPRTPCTLRISHNYPWDLYRYLKATIDLCYDILAGVQRAQAYLPIKPKYSVYFIGTQPFESTMKYLSFIVRYTYARWTPTIIS